MGTDEIDLLRRIKAKTDNIPTDPAKESGKLTDIAAKDFATQTTLALIKAKTDNIPTDPAKESGKLTDIAAKDFATQTTLALIKAKTDNLDTALSGVKTGTDKIPSQGQALAAASMPVVTPLIVKTIQTELLAITSIAAGAQQKSSELDISSVQKATIFIDHARDAATAFVGAGTEYRIQVSEKASGNDTWRNLYSVVCDITAASSIVTDAEEAAGQTRIETGATLPAVNDVVFFKNGTLANSEWARVIKIDATGGSEYFDILDGLTNTQPQQTMFNKAEQFVISMDLTSVKRLRCIVNNNNGTTNQAIVSRIAIITQG